MPAAWHPTRWCDWCLPEDNKQSLIKSGSVKS